MIQYSEKLWIRARAAAFQGCLLLVASVAGGACGWFTLRTDAFIAWLAAGASIGLMWAAIRRANKALCLTKLAVNEEMAEWRRALNV